jgi:hypothetical protein
MIDEYTNIKHWLNYDDGGKLEVFGQKYVPGTFYPPTGTRRVRFGCCR